MINFVKQYGERRTGTNYFRALLLINYATVTPLMHILGDKHSPPVEFDVHLQRTRVAAEPDWEFVRSATLAAPAESTRASDPVQVGHMRQIAAAVAHSVRDGTIGFAISAKHPYAWASSLARYSGWTFWRRNSLHMDPAYGSAIGQACLDYNRKYRSWLAHHERFASRSLLVRHEDLVEDPCAVLRRVEETFGFARSQESLDLIPRRVYPADWDQCHVLFERTNFNRDDYLEKPYVADYSPELKKLVEEKIDWGIARELGYPK